MKTTLKPADRLANLQESVIREMTRLAIEHQAINLSQGFPDFPAPAAVKEAAMRAIEEDVNQYTITWGNRELRRAIADKIERFYGLEFDPDAHITVTVGVTEAVAAAIMGTVNPGEEVIILEPYHETFLPAVVFAGAKPVFVPLEPPDYQVDIERLRQAFGPRTKAIIVNTPHNPTGRVFTREEMEGIAALCQEFDVLAITDEIYEHIIYDGREHILMATLPGMAERTITVSGMGKTYAVTGWRLGYAVALEPWSTALRTVHDFTTVCAPAPLQEGAITALSFGPDYYAQLIEEYTARRDAMMKVLWDNGFSAQTPEGAYYVMADFSGTGFEGDDMAFARWLATEVGVAVVPGSSFYYTPGLGHTSVRFAFPKRLETIEAAGERLAAGLAKLR
jgi:aminotransferase